MEQRVAYVLKAFGRTSETFITNEIYLLEQLGLPLEIFSLKQLAGQKRHGALGLIQSPVTYLPEPEELSGTNLLGWLWRNAGLFASEHGRLFRRRPAAYLATLAEALSMCFAYRDSSLAAPRKIFVKEFLQAGFIAARILQSPAITHLHAHFCHGATTVTMFASRLCGRPFSFTAHAKDIYLPELNPGDLLPRKLQRARFAVTCTGANRLHLDRLRPADSAPVHTIYHGLDTQLFRPLAAPLAAAKPAAPRILSVGRFVEKKGFTTLVEACALLRDRGVAFSCRIVGGKDLYQEQVAARIAALGLASHVELANAVTQEELREIYAGSAVFALPCQVLDNGDRDGIPNVLAEAMAMEMAVVSTNISGIPEIVRHGDNGLLVPPKDASSLADALQLLLEDAPHRAALGRNARRTILQVFDSRENTQLLAEKFFAVLGERPSAVPASLQESAAC